jgi:hypothetical protein
LRSAALFAPQRDSGVRREVIGARSLDRVVVGGGVRSSRYNSPDGLARVVD